MHQRFCHLSAADVGRPRGRSHQLRKIYGPESSRVLDVARIVAYRYTILVFSLLQLLFACWQNACPAPARHSLCQVRQCAAKAQGLRQLTAACGYIAGKLGARVAAMNLPVKTVRRLHGCCSPASCSVCSPADFITGK
jgi:hypothetical protein